MKKLLQIIIPTLLFHFSVLPLTAQCPVVPSPDFTYCYANNSTDVVAFEVCPQMAGATVTAAICQGNFELGFDNLTIYEGASGSGTGGTIVLGPSGGDLSGQSASTTTAGNCLIFVVNSDAAISCGDGSRLPLEVYYNSCPGPLSYAGQFCYANNSNNVVAFEVCGMPSEMVEVEVCQGTIEIGLDNLRVYEGASGSGTSGTPVTGPLDGNLAGMTISASAPGTCLIFVINSDGTFSCADGVQAELLVNKVVTVPLPAELTSFRAKEAEKHNILQWETASELNTGWFVVERSTSGTGNWQALGQVTATGFSNDAQRYTFEDIQPRPLSYYRLRILDFNGDTEFSELVVVERKSEQAFQLLNLSPVPATEELLVTYYTPQQSQISWSLMDMSGRVLTRNTMTSKGENLIEIPVGKLGGGVYLFSIESASERLIKKVVVK